MSVSRRKQIIYWAIGFVLSALIIEAGAWQTSRLLVDRGWMTEVPRFTSAEIATFFLHRHPELGWLADPELVADTCVSVYGDSFTSGTSGGSYPDAMSQTLNCHVGNYGVGGYGSDQALLLARRLRGEDRAPVTILAHVSENILRNVNQYRNLLYPDQKLFFKPRLMLDGATLRVLPVPISTPEHFDLLSRSPESVLPYDAFVDRPRREFPFALSIARWLFGDFHVRARLAGVPRHEPFYRDDHPAKGLQLTAAILSTFAIEMRNDGRTPVLLLLPVGDDFDRAKDTGHWPDEPLAERLRAGGFNVLQAGPKMAARIGAEDHCHFFEACNGHYNARGYALVAQILAEAIRELGPAALRAPGTP